MWYQQPLNEVLSKINTDSKVGLTQEGAVKRIESFGSNALPKGKRYTWLFFLLEQFKSPLVYILLIGALLTLWLEAWVDMSVILLAVGVNVAVGFWQEFRSNTVLEKLKEIVVRRTLVIRDGDIHEIDTEEVVPGDIIVIKAGQNVPADARLISSNRLQVNESAMTGESEPEKKSVVEISRDVAIGDRINMLYMGTIVTHGNATAVVVETGANTELGKIALLTQQADEMKTPLQERVGALGRMIALFVAIASVFIFVMGLFQEIPFENILTTAIAVAVAAIPEGLPAAISIILAVSAQRILRKKGVVKRLVAAETLGSTTVICTDKTGTLTEGKMQVTEVITEDNESRAYEIMALANEAVIEHSEDGDIIRGETTDNAKLQAFLDSGASFKKLKTALPRISLLPFDSSRKYLASLHMRMDSGLLFVTGAPEIILALSTLSAIGNDSKRLSEKKRKELQERYMRLARSGRRVIALADKVIETENIESVDLELEETQNEHISKLRFIGFVAIQDPIREDVRESIAVARRAGIRTIMLTGDHILTATSIAKELDFPITRESVMEGRELRELADYDLSERLKTVEIFARVNPEDKLRIVELLQEQGEVVAMTGDGINDAPSLKAADIGVAVNSGTDVAKAASDLILLNNSFSIIVEAVKQGRTAFMNIRKVTIFLLAGSFSELILILTALLFRIPLPLTAVQILWTNFVEDSLPSIALAFEPGEKDIMDRKPNKKNEPILNKESRVIIFAIGIFTDLILLGVFLSLYHMLGKPVEGSEELAYIRTIIFAALGLDTFFFIYSIKSLRKPIYTYNLFDNRLLIIATLLGVSIMVSALYVPLLNTLLGTVPLGLKEWALILILGFIQIIGVESVKWWFFQRKSKKPPKNTTLQTA